MLNLGLLGFAQPWLLLALASLPLLWWLLRVTPPAPRKLSFPAIRLLSGLKVPEETPARTPWWLLLLRLTIAALIILALAQPLLNPAQQLSGKGPVVMVIDDGWSAARFWDKRQTVLVKLLSQAEREDRPVILLTTAPTALGEQPAASGALPAAEALRLVKGLTPKPWPVNRRAALDALEVLEIDGAAQVFWFSDGLVSAEAPAEEGQKTVARRFAERLQRFGRLDFLRDGDLGLARLVVAPESQGLALKLKLQRAHAGGAETAMVLSIAEDGQLIARTPVAFPAGSSQGEAKLDLPAELRNRIARLQIEGESTAGAVLLLDERWRRRPVGLVSAGPLEDAQPMLSELYYLDRAMEPYTELRRGNVEELLQRDLAVLILPDSAGTVPAELETRLTAWIQKGGLLLRFAGPRLVQNAGSLVPVQLRGGDRVLGGAMTWDSPAFLAPFPAASPFAEIAVPKDVLIERQVLAEPALDLAEKTWARLADGTPLVTAERRGEGWVVLFHTTANTAWSNLPLSGLFVEMLQRVVSVSQGVVGDGGPDQPLAPIATLDGFGLLGAPAATVMTLDAGGEDTDSALGPRNPPGYYGLESQRRALNLGTAGLSLVPIGDLPPGVAIGTYARQEESDLKPWLLTAALVLALADILISLFLRGLMPGTLRRPAAAAAPGLALAVLFLLSALPQAAAQTVLDEHPALEATLSTRLAYVRTDVPFVDDTSRAGLSGLTLQLQRRTSIEASAPVGIDLASDELAFFSLLYWPITNQQGSVSEIERRKVNAYLKNGGTILFDLREATAGAQILGQASIGSEALQRITEGLDIPNMVPIPPEHVLTKAFYLLQDFPGRFMGGTLWVEGSEEHVNDGVASVIVGSNDWAGAWAVDNLGQPINALVPGGPRQREMAYRFGINLMMYALTGNYKADQVHVPFILERLGQ